ncbi:unnamed protein product [Urochloa humidicola]
MDVLNGDALGLVLERVDSHVSLIRAAAVCRRWRRAIADAAFLRRYRSLHAPPVAGSYHNPSPSSVASVHGRTVYGPVFSPSSPPLTVDTHHYSLDFIPDVAGPLNIRDSRGSLLLLLGFPNIVVCEPVTRRYKSVLLPTDLRDSDSCWGPYLLDGEADEAGGRISMSNFRVLCVFNLRGVTHATMFNVGSLWSEKNIDHIGPYIGRSRILGRASGSWYFYVEDRNGTLINLDGSTGEFSSSQLPAIEDWYFHIQRHNCCVSEGCDGKPRIIVVSGDTMKVCARFDSIEWVLEKKILLSEAIRSLQGYQPSLLARRYMILTTGEGFIILSQRFGSSRAFSVNLETMEVAPAVKNMGQRVYQCKLPWPPTLHACLDR